MAEHANFSLARLQAAIWHAGSRTKDELEGRNSVLVGHLESLGYGMVVDEGKREDCLFW